MTAKLPQSFFLWACYSVFKDRAACAALRLVLPFLRSTRRFLQLRGCFFYSKPRNLSTTFLFRCFVPAPLRSSARSLRSASFRVGRAFYFASASPVNRLRCFLLPSDLRSAFLPLRFFRPAGRAFYFVFCHPVNSPANLFSLSVPCLLPGPPCFLRSDSLQGARLLPLRRLSCQPPARALHSFYRHWPCFH